MCFGGWRPSSRSPSRQPRTRLRPRYHATCKQAASTPANAAADVGSTNMPSRSASRLCQRSMSLSSTATAEPPVSRRTRSAWRIRGGLATAMPPATVPPALCRRLARALERGGDGHYGARLRRMQPGDVRHPPDALKFAEAPVRAYKQRAVAHGNDDVAGQVSAEPLDYLIGECLCAFDEVRAEVVGGIDEGVASGEIHGRRR